MLVIQLFVLRLQGCEALGGLIVPQLDLRVRRGELLVAFGQPLDLRFCLAQRS